ncbi:hypothetical protein [Propionimicrobium lymphophilum]|uniref:hypothetical protein n=1 Tax=Propionimicrobium lymphophilum TaxID=33012 RepID=UPI0028892098|nr:hypothetical protein [Propionimicrobium lymphophilum]
MTYLEEYYQNKPYPFFIVHMVAIVGFVALVVTSVIMLIVSNAGAAVFLVHKVASWLLMIGLVVGAVEALVVKMFAPRDRRKPFGFRVSVLKNIATKREVAIYTTYCVLSWALIPVVFVFAFLSGARSDFLGLNTFFSSMDRSLLMRFHGASGIVFIVMIVVHVCLSVPARRVRDKANLAVAPKN